jgi:predicted nucleic acid-binding protein
MDVVVDSNAIVGDYWLRSKRWQLLLRRAESELVSLHVPEVVLFEVVKHYASDLVDVEASLKAAKKLTGRILIDRIVEDSVDVSNESAAYETFLRQTLASAGADFGAPAIDADELARWAVARSKPFKSDGSGVADAMIWLRTRELALGHDEAVLISNNHRDFGGDGHGGLHVELEAQLSERGHPNAVTRYPSPSEYHLGAGDHVELYEAEIERQLGEEGDEAQRVRIAVEALLDDRDARATGAWGSVAGPDETVFLARSF